MVASRIDPEVLLVRVKQQDQAISDLRWNKTSMIQSRLLHYFLQCFTAQCRTLSSASFSASFSTSFIRLRPAPERPGTALHRPVFPMHHLVLQLVIRIVFRSALDLACDLSRRIPSGFL